MAETRGERGLAARALGKPVVVEVLILEDVEGTEVLPDNGVWLDGISVLLDDCEIDVSAEWLSVA